MTVRYDIKQVTRYVLTRSVITDKGDAVIDMAEFTRRDDAERVLGTMRAAIHPVETGAAQQAAKYPSVKIGKSLAVSLYGLDALDEISALEVLEARVANTRKARLMNAAKQAVAT